MKSEQMLAELEGAADKLGVRVCYETLAADVGPGGLCKVKGEWRAIIDRRAPSSEKVALLAQALSQFDLDAVFLSPEVRDIIDAKRKPRSGD